MAVSEDMPCVASMLSNSVFIKGSEGGTKVHTDDSLGLDISIFFSTEKPPQGAKTWQRVLFCFVFVLK